MTRMLRMSRQLSMNTIRARTSKEKKCRRLEEESAKMSQNPGNRTLKSKLFREVPGIRPKGKRASNRQNTSPDLEVVNCVSNNQLVPCNTLKI